MGSGAESSKLLILPWAHIQEPTKGYLIKTKDIPITQEIPRVLRALCQEPEAET